MLAEELAPHGPEGILADDLVLGAVGDPASETGGLGGSRDDVLRLEDVGELGEDGVERDGGVGWRKSRRQQGVKKTK